MKKKNAFNKFCEEKAKNNPTTWNNVLTGNCRINVDPSVYGVRTLTFRKQANSEGFKTILRGNEVQIYR